MDYVIDSHIKFKKPIYPFGKMKVGDSFSVPEKEVKKLRSEAFLYGHNNKQRFSVKRFEKQYRCWRIE